MQTDDEIMFQVIFLNYQNQYSNFPHPYTFPIHIYSIYFLILIWARHSSNRIISHTSLEFSISCIQNIEKCKKFKDQNRNKNL